MLTPMIRKTRDYNERNRTRFTWLFCIALGVLIFLSESIWERQPIVEELLFLVACVFAGIGAMGRAWCAVFISGRKDGVLVDKGPYAMCRNPLYFFSCVGSFGVGLATETITIPLLIMLVFTLYYPSVILAEERRLSELFGDAFDEYRKRVPCFLPKISLLKEAEPNNYQVSTRSLRHSLFDALWFIWIIGLLELIAALHDVGYLPTLLFLY